MWLKKFRSLFVLSAVMFSGAPSIFGQVHPFIPVEDIHAEHNGRPFEAADLSQYGNGPKANEGFWFQYDRLVWAFSGPEKTTIGDPASAGIIDNLNAPDLQFVNFNSLDTGFINTEWVWGNRYELGYVKDGCGWMVSSAHAHNHFQSVNTTNVTIAFFDPLGINRRFTDFNNDGLDEDYNGFINNGGIPIVIFGNSVPLNVDVGTGFDINGNPVGLDGTVDSYIGPDFGDLIFMPQNFANFFSQNTTRYSTVELMHINRLDTFHNGSTWEWLFGARFINLTDDFSIRATGGTGSLTSYSLDARTNNYALGPQIGARWFQQTGRWQVGTEARFTAAANFQQARLNGAEVNRESLRTGSTQLFYSGGFNDSKSDTIFSPIGELRLDVAFQVTKAIYLKMGYTGTVVGGVTRASERVDYVLPNAVINENNKREEWIANGFNFGIEINR